MKKMLSGAALTLLASSLALAQQPTPTAPSDSPAQTGMMTTIPGNAVTITNYHKQNVYDPSDNKIGEVADLLVDNQGRITALIISVGGFLGMGEKDVAAPFQSVRATRKGNKWYLVMNTTKESLKSAPGYKFDSNNATWVAEKS